MEIKGSNIYVEASELPNLTQIIPSDKILVQPSNAPSLITFEDLIIDPINTTFYNTIEDNTSNVLILSSSTTELSGNIPSYLTTTEYSTVVDTVVLSGNNSIEYIASQVAITNNNLYSEYLTTIQQVSTFATAVKDWALFNSNGSIIASTPNIAGVTDNGGIQTLNFKTPYPTTAYCVIATSEDPVFSSVKVISRTVNNISLVITRNNAQLSNFDTVSVTIFYLV